MILQFLRAIFGRRPIPPIEIAQPTTLADLQREYDTLVKPAGPLYKETRKATPNVTPRKEDPADAHSAPPHQRRLCRQRLLVHGAEEPRKLSLHCL
jgi:hypothetical protein